MGLPVKKLLVATNSNDILHRCINNNDHSPKKVDVSLAPSMDIMISSNFERLLFKIEKYSVFLRINRRFVGNSGLSKRV